MAQEKDVGVAYLLWLFLGIFGGHKFYLRKQGMGVLYLLTAGLLFIGWFIDLFTLPSQVDDYNESVFKQQERDDLEERIEDLEDQLDDLEMQLHKR